MNKILTFSFKSLVSIILLYLILRKLETGQLMDKILEAEIQFLCIGVLLGLICNIIKIAKWSYLSNSVTKWSFWDGFQSYTIGFSFGLITPLRAGELGRALFYPQRYLPQMVGLTIFDRGLDVTAVMILSIPGSFFFAGNSVGIITSFISIIMIISLYRLNALLEIFKNMLPKKWRQNRFVEFLNNIKELDYRYISFAMGLSLLAFTLSIVELYFFVHAFEEVSIKAIALSIPLMSLSNLLPISIMGIGVRESVAYILLSKFNVSASAAVSAAFLSFIVNNLLLAAIGALFVPRVSFSSSESRPLSL